MSDKLYCYVCGEDGTARLIADLHWHGFGVHIDCLASLRARLADEQAKRVAAEKEVATWRNAVQCTSTEVYLAEQLRQAEERDAERVKKWASTVAERDERIADLERRLSTVPEDFGPLIDRAMERHVQPA